MKTAKEALACHLGMDISDLTDYNYQPGRYTKTIYGLSHGYYVAVRSINDLPKPTRKNVTEFKWVEKVDNFVNKYGWLIFTS